MKALRPPSQSSSQNGKTSRIQTPNSKKRSEPSTRNWVPSQHRYRHGHLSQPAKALSSQAQSLTLSRTTSTEKSNKEPNCLRIRTQLRAGDTEGPNGTFTRHLLTDSAITHIRSALTNANATKEVQVAGLGTTKAGYVIRFKDLRSAETARVNTEWLGELDDGTKSNHGSGSWSTRPRPRTSLSQRTWNHTSTWLWRRKTLQSKATGLTTLHSSRARTSPWAGSPH